MTSLSIDIEVTRELEPLKLIFRIENATFHNMLYEIENIDRVLYDNRENLGITACYLYLSPDLYTRYRDAFPKGLQTRFHARISINPYSKPKTAVMIASLVPERS